MGRNLTADDTNDTVGRRGRRESFHFFIRVLRRANSTADDADDTDKTCKELSPFIILSHPRYPSSAVKNSQIGNSGSSFAALPPAPALRRSSSGARARCDDSTIIRNPSDSLDHA